MHKYELSSPIIRFLKIVDSLYKHGRLTHLCGYGHVYAAATRFKRLLFRSYFYFVSFSLSPVVKVDVYTFTGSAVQFLFALKEVDSARSH